MGGKVYGMELPQTIQVWTNENKFVAQWYWHELGYTRIQDYP